MSSLRKSRLIHSLAWTWWSFSWAHLKKLLRTTVKSCPKTVFCFVSQDPNFSWVNPGSHISHCGTDTQNGDNPLVWRQDEGKGKIKEEKKRVSQPGVKLAFLDDWESRNFNATDSDRISYRDNVCLPKDIRNETVKNSTWPVLVSCQNVDNLNFMLVYIPKSKENSLRKMSKHILCFCFISSFT